MLHIKVRVIDYQSGNLLRDIEKFNNAIIM